MSQIKEFFVNDPEGDGLSFFDTEQQAKEFSEKAIKSYLTEEGWDEGAEFIYMGKVTHCAKSYNVPKNPGDNPDLEYVNYEMTPLKESPGPTHNGLKIDDIVDVTMPDRSRRRAGVIQLDPDDRFVFVIYKGNGAEDRVLATNCRKVW